VYQQQESLIKHDYQSKGLVPYLEQRHIKGHLISLLAQFPISGCIFSLPLEWRRWQKWYCFCPGDGNVRHCCPQSTNIHAWGLCLACNHLGQHDGCCSSGCLIKSKTKIESTKKILNEINFFFWENCRPSTKRTGHYA
jgi:hypothetical protein